MTRMTLMMLPNDLVLNCLARISRLYYPILSLVSKRFGSLLVSLSTELYQTRTLLGCTETCLYVCLKLPTCNSRQHWFTLCRRPNSTSKKVLVPITCPNSPYTCQSGFARVGSKIYAIGGRLISDRYRTSRVMVMDCRSHTWSDAPSMLVARVIPSAGVFDGKIYVTGGGCNNLDASNWMEVFDTKTQTWEFVSSSTHGEKVCSNYTYQSLVYDGKIHVRYPEGRIIYKTNKERWRAADLAMVWGWLPTSSLCVIENVLYSCTGGKIRWYDPQIRLWKRLEGDLDNLFWFPGGVSQLADYGGKLAVVWNHKNDNKTIWCAVIAVEKRQGGTISGTLEWFDVVFTTTDSEPYQVAHLVAVTL